MPVAPCAHPPPRSGARGGASRLLLLLVLSLLALQLQAATANAASEPAPTVYEGPSYPTAAGQPTADKPQSKLWHHDGSWWALMRVDAGISIHRLGADHVWVDTGTVVDNRLSSTGDALWDAGRLFVVSRAGSGGVRLSALSYDSATGAYTVDLTRQLTAGSSESVTVARDALGRLWIAFTQGSPRQVHVAHSTTDHGTWTAPFPLPVDDNQVSRDDIATITSFSGQVGVMWSDQGDDVVRFALHRDTDPDDQWSVETALSGPNMADDHINLKSLVEDDRGAIYAAVKTSRGDDGEPGTDPLIMVLQRAADGTWSSAQVSSVGDGLTRPQLAIDRTNRRVFVLMADDGGGSVYAKSAPLDTLAFPPGTGQPFITWPGAVINNPTTAKLPVTAETGLVVLASDNGSRTYYHGELSLGGGTGGEEDTAAPTVPAGLTATAASPTSVELSWDAATDDTGVTGYMITRDGTAAGTVTDTFFTDEGLAPSTTYTYTVSATDATGNRSPESEPVTVTTPDGEEPPPSTGPATFVSAVAVDTSGNTVEAPAPDGVQAGDLLVAAVSVRGDTTSITAPDGWTQVRLDTTGTMQQALYTAVATGGDDSATWTLNRSQPTVVQVLAYRGVDTTDPVLDSAGRPTSGSTLTSPAVPTVDGAPVLTVAGIGRAAELEPATGLTERAQAGSTTDNKKITANSADTTATATTAGPYDTTADGTNDGIAQTLALRPGPAGGDGDGGADTTAPSTPEGLTAAATSPTTVDLTWDAATDDTGVTEYRILRDAVEVATSTSTSYSDTGLTAGTTYSYAVVAVDAAGNASAPSAPAEVTTPAEATTPAEDGDGGADTTAPSVPQGLTAAPTSPTTVDLTWDAATDDAGVTEYRILRDAVEVATSTSTSYSDTGLTAATTYSYTVVAVDAAGNASAPSDPAEATTPPTEEIPPPSAGPATFVSAVAVDTSGNSVDVPAPDGLQAGDLLVAAVSVRGDTTAITAPDGWTLVRLDTTGTMQQALYTAVATGDVDTSTWTLNRSQPTVVQVLAYRGVDTTDPVLDSAGQITSGPTLTSPAVTTVEGAPVLTVAGIGRAAELEPAPGLTERTQAASTTDNKKISANSADTTATGTTAGAYDTTADGTNAAIAQTLALRPAA